MTASSSHVERSTPASARPPTPREVIAWTQRNRRRRGPQLKFVAALRGRGMLVWSDLAMAAAYEIDIFAQGDVRSIHGALEGDFSGLIPEGETGVDQMGGARLRLSNGREIDIDLVAVEPAFADFDAQGASLDAALSGPL
jgi:hypothetical protein